MRSVIWSVLALAPLAGMGRAADAEDYLTQDGKLRHGVEFRDGQSGFAGLTGTLWRVEPDGAWTVAAFRDEAAQKKLRQGKLSEKQLAALAGHLAALDVTGLPKDLGSFTGANPHVFSLRFGERTATVTVAPGQALTETTLRGEVKAAWSRFVAAAALLQRWTAGDEGK
jgi:hypothetical protein